MSHIITNNKSKTTAPYTPQAKRSANFDIVAEESCTGGTALDYGYATTAQPITSSSSSSSSCSSRLNNYRYDNMSILHTPPPSTHKHHLHCREQQQQQQSQAKKQKTSGYNTTQPSPTITSPTPTRSASNNKENNIHSASCTFFSAPTTPTTPPSEQSHPHHHHRHHHHYQHDYHSKRQQVNTPPPTMSAEARALSLTDNNLYNALSTMETKLKLIQLKMDNVEESSTKNDINELLQSTLEELQCNKRKSELPRRKFDEFIMTPPPVTTTPEYVVDGEPMTPEDQIIYKNDLGSATPPRAPFQPLRSDHYA
ncbi:hypothetical protein KGF57_000324 [Candida theae]|uniref:Uncharacterized protein n=1 Tax=Candida theae TaxID=1198502 RepID=A0AAD5G0X5_9ASCO|nr:uncharacterized protein KGF57_000324 [Candida theae]KAI5967596.1 hypothetical protein KGF57_000324 [Candida theae]